MLDLAQLNADGEDHQITTTFNATIMASATLTFSYSATVGAQLNCRLEISDGTGPDNGLTPMGAAFGATVTMLPGGTGVIPNSYFATLPLIGAANMPPGTYNVQARCSIIVPTCGCEHPAYRGGHLNVWAVGN